jgi:hypothetical protein
MRKVFDPVEAIFEMIDSFYLERGRAPAAIVISRNTYRRLLEIEPAECKVGSVMNGVAFITVISTPWGKIQLIIDELLEDTRVEVDG